MNTLSKVKDKGKSKLIAFFADLIPEGSQIQPDGFFPQRFTMAEIETKLKEHSISTGIFGIYWWLLCTHKVSYYQEWKFYRSGPWNGKDTELALVCDDPLG